MGNISWILLLLCINCMASTFSYSTRRNNNWWRSNCKQVEYECGSGECINEDMICDGQENCSDGSDESSCLNFPCPTYAFKCSYGACINSNLVCDGKKDCKDNSDELLYQCNEATGRPQHKCNRREFACVSGECIDDFNLCDGKPHCLDASDETVKTCSLLNCPKYATRCEYGGCINSNLVCNGWNDCYDGSDEKYCGDTIIVTSNPFTLGPQQGSHFDYEYQCGPGNTITINKDMICDGREDCQDGSDESSCLYFPCPEYSFRCTYGACINSNFVCDGKTDCKDNSDEALCTGVSGMKPKNNCSRTEYTCNSGECIDDFDLCDGTSNCLDGSDEIAEICIHVVCLKYAYKCAYGACINMNLRCNGIFDCLDGSDENYCNDSLESRTSKPLDGLSKSSVLPTSFGSKNLNDLFSICKLPEKTENGDWKIYNEADNLIPGTNYVKKYTILIFECDPNYAPYPDTSIAVCTKGWNEIPKCLKTCPSINSTNVMTATCTLNNKSISCDYPVEGARALFFCAPWFEDKDLERNPYRTCKDGNWDYSLPNCERKYNQNKSIA